MMCRGLVLAVLALPVGVGAAERRLSLDDYRDKMTAGWLGQMVGVEWGLPTEFKWQGSIIPNDKVPVWKPETVNGGFVNDDLYVEMTFLRTLELHGLMATTRQAGIDYANSQYGLCAANWVGRDNLRRGIAPPDCGHPDNNLCADDIDYQIESDFAGLISPGLPQQVIRLGNVFGSLVNQGDGVWAGQFMGGMYAEAFFTKDVDRLIDAGLRCIPAESQYAQMVRDVRAWHAESPDGWETCWAKVKARYIDDSAFHRGKIDQPGSDVKPNGAFVVMGLLYGNGDFDRTMRVSMRCGWDSDCNPSSAAGVLATALGSKALLEKFPCRLDRTRKFSYTPYAFDDLLRVCERLARDGVIAADGRIEKDEKGTEWLVVPDETPVPDAFRPNWNPPLLTGARYSPEEMQQIKEKAFPGVGESIRRGSMGPHVPIGDQDFFTSGHADEKGLSLVILTNAPFDLDREELPICINGLSNTVIHLAWAKLHTTNACPIFAFENCDNIVLKHGSVIRHGVSKEKSSEIFTSLNSSRLRSYGIGCRFNSR